MTTILSKKKKNSSHWGLIKINACSAYLFDFLFIIYGWCPRCVDTTSCAWIWTSPAFPLTDPNIFFIGRRHIAFNILHLRSHSVIPTLSWGGTQRMCLFVDSSHQSVWYLHQKASSHLASGHSSDTPLIGGIAHFGILELPASRVYRVVPQFVS